MKLWFVVIVIIVSGCGGSDFMLTNFDTEDSGPPAVTPVGDAGAAPADAPPETSDVGAGGALGAGGNLDTGGSVTGNGGKHPGAGGHPPTADACIPVTHSNGTGQTWQDCVPAGTWTAAQAMKACAAKTGDARACSLAPGCGSAAQVVSGAGTNWGFAGNTAGFVGLEGACPNSETGKEWR